MVWSWLSHGLTGRASQSSARLEAWECKVAKGEDSTHSAGALWCAIWTSRNWSRSGAGSRQGTMAGQSCTIGILTPCYDDSRDLKKKTADSNFHQLRKHLNLRNPLWTLPIASAVVLPVSVVIKSAISFCWKKNSKDWIAGFLAFTVEIMHKIANW